MKILCLGDSPFHFTGFGVVNRVAHNTLMAAGHRLVTLAGLEADEHEVPDGHVFIPSGIGTMDVMGWALVPKVIEEHQPDAVHIIGDPATVTTWLLHEEIKRLPVVAYMPIEGEPLNRIWTKVWETKPDIKFITCSNYGVCVMADAGYAVPMAYHGVGPEFQRYEQDRREAYREAVGWDGKFIVMNVAANVRRKQWPRLFEAIGLLQKRHPDIYLYAHTKAFNNFYLGGHDLPQLAEQIGVADRVIFPHFTDSWEIPLNGQTEPGLVDLYNMADMFVLPSQVEGFGLPLAEAMACGLPVVTTDHAAQAEVVNGAGKLIPVHDWEWNQSHQKYANVHPRDIADAIERVYRNPEIRRQMSRKSLERARAFSWDDYRKQLVEAFGAEETDQTAQEDDPQLQAVC